MWFLMHCDWVDLGSSIFGVQSAPTGQQTLPIHGFEARLPQDVWLNYDEQGLFSSLPCGSLAVPSL